MYEEEYRKVEPYAEEAGFEHYHFLDPGTMVMKPEVRDMCKANTCGKYGASWACPPACGSIEEYDGQVHAYHWGIVVQTVGELEDSLDFEGIMEASSTHSERFKKMVEKMREEYPGMMALGAGTCTICKKCTYPDEPCRFPDRRITSVEATGVVVNEMCKANGLEYNYGPNTIAYTSCVLVG